MAKVLYKQGTKATYLGLTERVSNALYFCTDTRELYKGNDLYSDGLRIVEKREALPALSKAADGILYFCKDNGCGYVLNEERSGWLPVIYGVDNKTIVINSDGMIAVRAVPIDAIEGLEEKIEEAVEEQVIINNKPATNETAGLVKASTEVLVGPDGAMSIGAIEPAKIIGLEDRFTNIEKALVSGIRYRGAVQTKAELPADAEQGDLYEVREDNSEWCFNGEKWFEYGKAGDTKDLATKKELFAVAERVAYEISHKPEGALVNQYEKEIRVMCPSGTQWALQESGDNANPYSYYIGFKAYAPNDSVVGFKEDLSETINDQTMYGFDGEFAGIDEFGRKYSIVWLPVAQYDETTSTWTYHGAKSNDDRCVGWYYSVEWYNAKGIKVHAETIRINLTNEDCHNSAMPYYVSELRSQIAALEDSFVWEDM